jgi:hypothetical protein
MHQIVLPGKHKTQLAYLLAFAAAAALAVQTHPVQHMLVAVAHLAKHCYVRHVLALQSSVGQEIKITNTRAQTQLRRRRSLR